MPRVVEVVVCSLWGSCDGGVWFGGGVAFGWCGADPNPDPSNWGPGVKR